MDKIAFVCQRYGAEVNGGSEAECRMYAQRLTPYYDVEVITTCALDYTTWENHYEPGVSHIDGVTVRRFPVDVPRDVEAFTRLSVELGRKERRSRAEEAEWLRAQGPLSSQAVEYIRGHAGEYKAVIFMTYLYYLTAVGLPGIGGRAILVPTAHDEWPIYFTCYRSVFERADGYVYNSGAEKRFVDSLFLETSGKPSVTVGAGVEYPGGALPDVGERFGLTGEYLLYAGRISPSKGCEELFEYFAAWKEHRGGDVKLVLCGKAVMDVPAREDVVALGFVSEEEKYALMAGAAALVLASQFESLSIVVLESMLMGTPVLVNGGCAVLKDHVLQSNAGLWFENEEEFAAALDWLLSHPRKREEMGRLGREYVQREYNWDIITHKLRALVETVAAER